MTLFCCSDFSSFAYWELCQLSSVSHWQKSHYQRVNLSGNIKNFKITSCSELLDTTSKWISGCNETLNHGGVCMCVCVCVSAFFQLVFHNRIACIATFFFSVLKYSFPIFLGIGRGEQALHEASFICVYWLFCVKGFSSALPRVYVGQWGHLSRSQDLRNNKVYVVCLP